MLSIPTYYIVNSKNVTLPPPTPALLHMCLVGKINLTERSLLNKTLQVFRLQERGDITRKDEDLTLVQHHLTGCLYEQGAKLSCVKMAGHGRGCGRHQINSSPIQDPIINDTIWVPPAKSPLHRRT